MLEAEKQLAMFTLRYLLMDDFRQGNIRQMQQKTILLEYSAVYWTEHVHDVRDDDTLIYELTNMLLLDPRFSVNYQTFLETRQHPSNLNTSQISMSHAVFHHDPDLSPLYYPVFCGLTWVVKRFIEQNPTWVDQAIGEYGTPLVIAAGQNDSEMIKVLVNLGANINKGCKTKLWNEIRPLYYAVYLDNQKAVEVLLEKGVDINLGCRYVGNNSRSGTPIIHTAAYWGRKESLVKLIEAGADIEARDGEGSTALHSALAGASLDAIRVLFQAGCNLQAIGDSGKTAIQCALELRNGPIIEYLFENIGDPALIGKLQVEELDWAKSEPWYPRIAKVYDLAKTRRQEISIQPSTSEVYQVYSILRTSLGLPKEVSALILDLAGFWVKTTAKRQELVEVTEDSEDVAYIAVTVGGPVRRITFCTKSHDQGMAGIL
jgi:ankyrin repeat protein